MCEMNSAGHLKSMSQSEKWRFVVMLGRVKESTTNLRRLHKRMAEDYDEIMAPGSGYTFFLTGDLKYLSSMNGHSGCASSFPCTCCVRSRKAMVSNEFYFTLAFILICY